MWGGGWGNENLVENSQGYYRPTRYGRQALGLSGLNVNNQTGELTGSLNRFGQALGTEYQGMGRGPRRVYGGWSSNTERGPWKFNPAQGGKQQNQGKGGGGNGTKSGGYNPGYWQNELISWRF